MTIVPAPENSPAPSAVTATVEILAQVTIDIQAIHRLDTVEPDLQSQASRFLSSSAADQEDLR